MCRVYPRIWKLQQQVPPRAARHQQPLVVTHLHLPQLQQRPLLLLLLLPRPHNRRISSSWHSSNSSSNTIRLAPLVLVRAEQESASTR